MNTITTTKIPVGYSLKQLAIYFLQLGTWGFGGPVALIGYMHRDLVEKRKWLPEEDYKEGLALAQLAPGPLAAQLAIYTGYVHYGVWGATVCGLAFVIPSFLMVVALGYAYVRYGGLWWMQGVFYGIGPAVIGIITLSCYKLTKKTVGKEGLSGSILVVMAAVTFITESENIALVLAAGILVWLYKTGRLSRQRLHSFFLFPVLLQITAGTAVGDQYTKIGWFFLKAGAFVFGSGLAIVPFLYGGVVKDYHWLNERQFLDAVAVAMITPGPVVITVGFIGYLVAGLPGACIAAGATFIPCYLFTILPAPYFKKYSKKTGIKAFVTGVTVAAVGAIAGSVLVLAKRQLSDITSILITLVVMALLIRYKKLPEPVIIVLAALAGMALYRS